MAGYREHSFDPGHWEPMGPPLKPYNWVQWTGVGFALLGAAICLYFLLGRAGLVPPIDSPMPGALLPLIGVSLINSRRAEIPEEKRAEYREKQRRRTYIALSAAAAAAVIGFAAAYLSHGA
jgi:alkylated DNA repair dioxygenase AlkB